MQSNSPGNSTWSHTFRLGGNPWEAILCLLIGPALLLLPVWFVPYLLENGPFMPAWQAMAFVGCLIAGVMGVILIGYALFNLLVGLLYGRCIVLTADGVQRHNFLGSVTAVGWDDGLEVQLTKRTVNLPVTEAPVIPLNVIGNVVTILHDLTAQREDYDIYGVAIQSESIRLRREPLAVDMAEIMRWMMCRELEKAIRALGGSVEWHKNGFSSVNLAGMHLSDETFQALANKFAAMPHLQSLDLSYNDITMDSFLVLRWMPALTHVEAVGTNLDQAALQQLCRSNAKRATT